MSNNPPDVILELTSAQAAFLMGNCDSNIAFGLSAMQNSELSRASVEKLVALMEEFKGIRKALIKAGVPT